MEWQRPKGAEHIWVVVRYDATMDPENAISLTKAYWQPSQAEAEAERLNELNAGKGAHYQSLVARLQPYEERQPPEHVVVRLSRDEALVLDALLWRESERDSKELRIEDQAERRVLWDLEAIIEQQLAVYLWQPNYDEIIAAARDAVRDAED